MVGSEGEYPVRGTPIICVQNGDNQIMKDEGLGGSFSYDTGQTLTFPPKCYRCDFSNYGTRGEYEYHCVTRHPGLPAYPGPADIKESGLTPQGMLWEV